MPIHNYTHEELINEPTFVEWVLSGTNKHHDYWSDWLGNNPQYATLVDEAKEIVLLLQFKQKRLSDAQLSQSWDAIQSNIDKRQKHTRRRYIVLGALVVAFTIASIFIYKKINNRTATQATAFAEMLSVELPDNSVIQLNANSSISYPNTLIKNSKREVWLKGQALFDVQHQAQQPFVVHTPSVAVEVLGTTFDIIARPEKTKIALVEGSIKLAFDKEATINYIDTIYTTNEWVLVPNQVIELEGNTWQLSDVNAVQQTSWIDNKLICDETPIQDLVYWIESNLGYEVVINEEAILNETINGTLPISSMIDLKTALEPILGVSISIVDENKVIFEE